MSLRAPRRLTLVATGAGGGAVAGLLGGGGGAVMIPLMTGLLKMKQHTAHGTSLVIIVFAALASAITYTLNADVDWLLTATLISGSTAGAYLGARGAGRLNAMRLRQCLGAFLLLICGRLLFFPELDPVIQSAGAVEAIAGLAIGLAGGLAAGALGVGGGAIFVPAMVLLLGTGQHEAQGISLWVVVAAALVGSVTHHRHGTVDMAAARWIVPLAVPAGAGASYLATRLSDGALQTTFAILLSLIGVQMITTATLRLRSERSGAMPAFEAEAA
jgi:uncharacterized protein